MKNSRLRSFAHHTALLAASIAMTQQALAAPADVMTSPAPGMGAAPPKAREIKDGDTSVSTQTGAFEYRYPIEIPPGRLGAQPQLALKYSSNAPIYGDIAAGWSLGIPEILLDTSYSVLKQKYPPVSWVKEKYLSTLTGSQPLLAVTEPIDNDVYLPYRAQNDDNYVRYERMRQGEPYLWRARTMDGTTYYFGDQYLSDGWSQPTRVPLTRTVDSFGNTVEYRWIGTELQEIKYSSNPGAGLAAFARVEFHYQFDTCGTRLPIGAGEDHRLASPEGYNGTLTGRRRLDTIRAVAFDPANGATQHTRDYTLAYDPLGSSCIGVHGPMRILTSIQQSAWGAATPRIDLPPVTFEYNRLSRNFEARVAQSIGNWAFEPAVVTDGISSGRRAPTSWTRIEQMMIDFDGDARPDRVYLSNSSNDECTFQWQKNLGRSEIDHQVRFSVPSSPQVMPRLPWGGLNRDPAKEWCALNAQFTLYQTTPDGDPHEVCGQETNPCYENTGSYFGYRWMDLTGDGKVDLVGAIQLDPGFLDPDVAPPAIFFAHLGIFSWPSCQEEGAQCPVPDQTCMLNYELCDEDLGCDYDPGSDGCFERSPNVDCGRMMKQSGGPFQPIADPFDHPLDPGCVAPNTPFDPSICVKKLQYKRCDGLYPWFIWTNIGGQFSPTGEIKYQPGFLESESGDGSIGGVSGLVDTYHTVQDFDGDGRMDLAVRPTHVNGQPPPSWWNVWIGDGAGGFEPEAPGRPYIWHTPPNAPITYSCSAAMGNACGIPVQGEVEFDLRSYVSMLDLNGDGALDYVWTELAGDYLPHVFFGNGRKFWSSYDSNNNPSGHLLGSGIEYLSRGHAHRDDYSLGAWIHIGWKETRARTIDLDSDGRPDLIESTSPGYGSWNEPLLYMNAGGDFLPAQSVQSSPDLLAAFVQRTDTMENFGFGEKWAVRSDLVDLDGDGLLEHWDMWGLTRLDGDGAGGIDDQPLRLMKRIDNGTGGTVEIKYAATSNPAVVEQHPELGKSVPQAGWVVRSVSARDRWDPDVSTTRYEYSDPVWSQDERGRWGFRGFEEVTTFSPSGSRVVENFGFDVDWSGRNIATRVYSVEDTAGPRTITEITWQNDQLFGGIDSYHAAITRSWTCANQQSEATCKAVGSGFVKKVSYWVPVASSLVSGPAQAWVPQQECTQRGENIATGDRCSFDSYYLYSDGSNYRLQTTEHSDFEQTVNGPERYAHSTSDYDSQYRMVVLQTEFVDEEPWAGQPHTTYDYDDTTGLLLGTRAPRNYPSGPQVTHQYDPTGRFVIFETNELGHVVEKRYDPGTGQLLAELGPNRSSCGLACTNEEASWTDVDGLGRPIATFKNIAVAGNPVWQRTQTARIIYTDAIAGGQPTKVTVENRVEYDEDRWTHEETTLDGQGRPKLIIQRTGLANDSIITHDYDHRGHLVSMSVPDPSQNSAATVTYSYNYDSLGRPTYLYRPAISSGNASGYHRYYNGLNEDRYDIAGGQGGPLGRTALIRDVFGRLVEVREYLDAGFTRWASTFYAYDAQNRVRRVENPTGVVTEMAHDFAGNRTKITRGGRDWLYTYANDLLVSERSPLPAGGLAAQYTTTFTYDEAGRLSAKVTAPRALSPTDLTLFGVGPIALDYDQCPNGVGRLCAVELPNGTLHIDYEYDPEGNRTLESRSFNFAGITGTRSSAYTYGVAGRAREHKHADNQIGMDDATRSRTQYDDRGLPVGLLWQRQTSEQLARQTRNVSGLVTQRRTDFQSAGWHQLSTEFNYDKLSRVSSQIVRDTTTSTELARQELGYFGMDDVQSLRHVLGSEVFNFSYQYNTRHILTNVNETANRLRATYTFTNAGQFQRATVTALPAAGSDAVNRNVLYEYNSPIDPEAVSALRPSSGAPLRSYTYDAAGNMITRASAVGTDSFVYDGDDQLRRAITAAGVEEYFYDHDGNRAAVVTRNSSNLVERVRVFFGDTELTYNSSSAITKTYAYLSLGTAVARVTDRTGLELQYHGLANNTLLSANHLGSVQAAFVYGPYGEILLSSGANTGEQRRRFNDKFRDDATALNYYGVRYYDSLLLGWTQADPAFRWAPDAAWDQPRRANLYTFSLTNPLRYLDPDGRNPFDDISMPTWSDVKSVGKTMVKEAVNSIPVVRYTRTFTRLARGDVRGAASNELKESAKAANAVAPGAGGAVVSGVLGGLEGLVSGNVEAKDALIDTVKDIAEDVALGGLGKVKKATGGGGGGGPYRTPDPPKPPKPPKPPMEPKSRKLTKEEVEQLKKIKFIEKPRRIPLPPPEPIVAPAPVKVPMPTPDDPWK